jgi:hypothetical protein
MGCGPGPFLNLRYQIIYITENFWLVKSMATQALEHQTRQQNNILHNIQVFRGRFEAVYKYVSKLSYPFLFLQRTP